MKAQKKGVTLNLSFIDFKITFIILKKINKDNVHG